MAWRYKMHDSGLGLVRADWDTVTFESYHGNGKWVEDEYGFDLWSGKSSADLHYTKITAEQALEVVKKIDEYIKGKTKESPPPSPPQGAAPTPVGAAPPPQG